ncbi:MAG TPA: lytic transglycosylase domain-containing protein [Propionicimonas sp.]|uniref:lytic transglycosylase domain-containing protein n=1 Tax=Propionicimonas sp. TaxID=1955623 RepID=UPI002F41E9E3
MALTELVDIELPAPRWSVRAVLPLVGSLLGAFGLVGVMIGVMSIGAVQRSSAAFVVPTPDVVAVAAQDAATDPGGGDSTARARSVNDTAAIVDSPTRRVDPAWATRTAAATGIPVRAVLAYGSATLTVGAKQPGCHLAWNTLAGIGAVESAHGTHSGARLLASGTSVPAIRGPALNGKGVGTIRDSDNGAWDGDRSWDRAVGPMQFIPGTWRRWGTDGSGDGVADPDQIDDAALTAARYLCASGSLASAGGWRAAILSYNHSDAYVNSVAEVANSYAAATRG